VWIQGRMSTSLGANISSMRAIRLLEQSSNQLGAVFERLSSGQRINRASDDAAGLAVASQLQANARIANQALQNITYGISVISVADQAVASLRDIVIRQIELAEQSANGVLSTTQRLSLDTEAQALRAEYQRIVATTSFNDLKIFNGDLATLQIQAGVGDDNVLAVELLRDLDGLVKVSQTQTMFSNSDVFIAQNQYTEGRLLAFDTGGQGDVLVGVSWVTDIASNRMAVLVQTYKADQEGVLQLVAQRVSNTNTDVAAASDVSLNVTLSNNRVQFSYFLGTVDVGRMMTLDQDGNLGNIQNLFGTVTDASSSSVTGNFTGLASDETVQANAPAGGALTFTAMLNQQGSVTESLEQQSFSLMTAASALMALDQLKQNLADLSDLRARLGAAESRFGVASQVVQATREQSLQAASRIMDADIAQESADLIRLTILQQTAASVLAQTNIQPELVLRLLAA